MIRVQGSESFRNAPSDDSAISPSHLEVKGPFCDHGSLGFQGSRLEVMVLHSTPYAFFATGLLVQHTIYPKTNTPPPNHKHHVRQATCSVFERSSDVKASKAMKGLQKKGRTSSVHIRALLLGIWFARRWGLRGRL